MKLHEVPGDHCYPITHEGVLVELMGAEFAALRG